MRTRGPTNPTGILPALSGVAVLTASSWAYLVLLAVSMNTMGSPLAMSMMSSWRSVDLGLVWTMWAAMMAAMMLPSAAPMIAVYASTVRSERALVKGSTTLFVFGYLVVWIGFATVASATQWAMHKAALVDGRGAAVSHLLGGGLLVAAGAYQFSNLKTTCLRQCRTPLGFLLAQWREGPRGAFVMGMRHGEVCVGCCWAIMALLFVLGVMNLWWIAAVSAIVLAEKVVPSVLLTRLMGAGLGLWGVAVLVAPGS